MTGRHTIEIDAKDFVRGMSTSKYLSDGGFSPETDAVNLIATPGALFTPDAPVDKSTNLTGNLILSADDPNYLGVGAGGNEKMFIDDENAFYRWNGTTLTKKVTASTTTYLSGSSAFVPYKGYWYASQQNGGGDDITRWDGDITLVENWWSALLGDPTTLTASSHRPMIVYEDNLWIGNRNILGKFDGTTGTHKLTLDTFQSIVALGIDPGSGYMLIATHETGGANSGATKNGLSKILTYDGFSDKPLRATIIDGMVTAFYTLGGTTFIFYGDKMGYWNGSGITFLRKNTLSFNNESLVYPGRVTSIDNTLYFAEGRKVIAYGEVLPGQKVFYPAFYQDITSTQKITLVSATSNNKLGISWDDGSGGGKFYTLDVTATASNASVYFRHNWINFPRPVFIRSAVIEYTGVIPTGETHGSLYVNTQDQQSTSFGSLTNNSSGNVGEIETKSMDLKIKTGQFVYSVNSPGVAGVGIKRITIYYDVAE